jgi:hypothetical protein
MTRFTHYSSRAPASDESDAQVQKPGENRLYALPTHFNAFFDLARELIRRASLRS